MKIAVAGVDGNTATITVVGLAYTADQGFYPQTTPGLIWVLPATLQQVEKVASETEEVVGLRVGDPSANGIGQVVQEVYNAYHTTTERSPVEQVTTWQQVDASMASNDRLLGLLLGLFGIIALIAAPLRDRQRHRRPGAGAAPRHRDARRARLHPRPGRAGAAGRADRARRRRHRGRPRRSRGRRPGAPRSSARRTASRSPSPRCPRSWMALAAAVTVGTVAVATVVPAWRAGRVSPVAAVAASPPRGRLSRLARIGLLVRLPVPLVLGARDSFTRRLPAALTIVGVAIPMAMITIALTCWTTLDGFTSDPGRIDLAAALTVYPGSESIQAEQAQLARDPQIAADYPGAEFDTLLPGATATFTARAMGTSARPYPFNVAQGAMFTSYNEAIAGRACSTCCTTTSATGSGSPSTACR